MSAIKQMINGKVVESLTALDNWDSFKPLGEIYPRIQLRACPVEGGTWAILDETGWDGFSETEDTVLETEGEFPTMDAAMERIRELVEKTAELCQR